MFGVIVRSAVLAAMAPILACGSAVAISAARGDGGIAKRSVADGTEPPNPVEEIALESETQCVFDQHGLLVRRGGHESRIAHSLQDDEVVFGSACNERLAALLTNKAMYLYPGTRELLNVDPKDVEYVRLGFKQLDQGVLSRDGTIVLIRKDDSLEAYRITPGGLDVIISYGILVPMTNLAIDEERRHLVVETLDGGVYRFDFEGREVWEGHE